MPVLDKPYMKVLTMIPGIRQLIFSKIRSQLLNALGGKVYEVIMGGAALSKDVEKILSMVKFPFTVGYGMTECGPIITYSDWKEVERSMRSSWAVLHSARMWRRYYVR